VFSLPIGFWATIYSIRILDRWRHKWHTFSSVLFGIARKLKDRKWWRKRKKKTKGESCGFGQPVELPCTGTISEPWWLTACPSCSGKNSSPLRHVANTCPALASASTDLFTTCCRTILRRSVLFCQYIPEQLKTIKVCVRDSWQTEKIMCLSFVSSDIQWFLSLYCNKHILEYIWHNRFWNFLLIIANLHVCF